MLVSDYNYELPEERIAKFPPRERGSTRLLVLNRKTGAIQDSYYRNLDELLNPGDVLILNDTRVMQSRLFCQLPDGRERELVVLEKHGDEPERVMYRGKLRDGDTLFIKSNSEEREARNIAGASQDIARASQNDTTKPTFPDGAREIVSTELPKITIEHILGNGIAEVESEIPLEALAEKYGTVPLPPYLHRDATEDDRKRYQTVWAKNMGSAAAPTASLNMTEDLLSRLQQKGVIIKYLTLHVGLGTFLPIRTENIEDHQIHSEWFYIPEDTLEAIKSVAKSRTNSSRGVGGAPSAGDGAGGTPAARSEVSTVRKTATAGPADGVSINPHPRIIAVGTTVARTLEYYARTGKTSGEDDIYIYPGYEFQIVDALLTNYHAPKSTVLMLASAFAGWDHLKNAYEHAIEQKYNFLSYGDSMLIC